MTDFVQGHRTTRAKSHFFSQKPERNIICQLVPHLSYSWGGWTAPRQGRADPEQSLRFHSSASSEQSQTVLLRKEANFSHFYPKYNFSISISKTENFLMYFFFSWRIIALQNCDGFCQMSTWISQGIHMSPPPWTSGPSPSPSHPSRLQSPCLSSLSHTGICFTYGDVSFHVTLSIQLTLSFLSPSHVHISLFSMCVSLLLPCRNFHQYHLSRLHIYVLVHDIYLSLSYLFHSVY